MLMNLCLYSPLEMEEQTLLTQPSGKSPFVSRHGSRVPLKPCVRKAHDCGRHWWMAGPSWQ